MKNPYEVLGLSSDASIDDVKKAYREKAKIYNEDYKKMDELNDAYDTIIMNFGNNRSGAYSNTSEKYAYDSGRTGNASEFGDIRAKLNSGRIDDAEMLLDGIPSQRRNAEWYYLKGTIQHRRGWLESAAENFETAYKLEPENPEYNAAYKQLHRERRGAFRQERNTASDNDGCCDSPCKMCSSLICADCCCECMGGDLIRCC